MGYCGCMGYGALFPAKQLSGLKNVWNLREYGVCEPWVKRESTVEEKEQKKQETKKERKRTQSNTQNGPIRRKLLSNLFLRDEEQQIANPTVLAGGFLDAPTTAPNLMYKAVCGTKACFVSFLRFRLWC